MPILRIYKDNHVREVEIKKGISLHTALTDLGYEIYSPCGGKGKCGKCTVFIKGAGSVVSCRYFPVHDTEVILPDRKELEILVSQYKNSIEVPFSPAINNSLSERPIGLAIDIGTTTMVFYFADLSTGSLIETRSMLNPQSKYGADVISRINFCANDPVKLRILQREALSAINSQIDHFVHFIGITHHDIVKVTVSANTTMLHLLAGVDPLGIATAPYIPVFTERRVLGSTDPMIRINPGAEVILLPSVSAYVGADIAAGLASVGTSGHKNILYLDIGTNGEIALITGDRILCCATAAGPAFEGANITCGTGAFEGAVSEFNAEGYKTIAGGKPSGICGSGLVDIVAFLLDKGIVDNTGYMKEDYVVVPASETVNGAPVVLTPSDIREVQLAKSAVYSGISILLKRAGILFRDIDLVYIAGGFGNYIRTAGAMRIGLLPGNIAGKIIPVGNASGTGALLSLRSVQFDNRISEIISRTEYIELSMDEEFAEEYALNMYF